MPLPARVKFLPFSALGLPNVNQSCKLARICPWQSRAGAQFCSHHPWLPQPLPDGAGRGTRYPTKHADGHLLTTHPYPILVMKTPLLTWLAAGLLTLPAAALAQVTVGLPVMPERAVLGGPPQPTEPPAAAPTKALAQLRQLPAATLGLLPPQELAQRLAPQPTLIFRADIAALATARPVVGRPLVVLTLPADTPGVPAGGAALGQRLKLGTAAGEQLVAVAQAAAAGSHTLIVSATRLAGPAVYVYGLEHATEPDPAFTALTQLHLQATRELAEQVAGLQQQVAELQRRLTASQRLAGELLLDHDKISELQQQLKYLQSQQAALSSGERPRRVLGWGVD